MDLRVRGGGGGWGGPRGGRVRISGFRVQRLWFRVMGLWVLFPVSLGLLQGLNPHPQP